MSENVSQFPSFSERLIKRGTNAMSDYTTCLADIAQGRQKAIRAVIEYGEVLRELRAQHRSNLDFNQAITLNRLDAGSPWNQQQERTAAMLLAGCVQGNTTLDDCPHTTPTNVMKWFRKTYPNVRPAKLPKPPKPAKPPKVPALVKAIEVVKDMVRKGETLTNKDVKTRAKVSENVAYSAINAYQALRPRGEPAAPVQSPDEDEQLAAASFSEKSKLTIAHAIEIHKKRLDKTFEHTVNAEVRRRIDSADDAARKAARDAGLENIRLKQLLQQSALFTPAEFKLILMCLHPDNAASTEVRARAFDLFRQKERRLTGQ